MIKHLLSCLSKCPGVVTLGGDIRRLLKTWVRSIAQTAV